jgi:hypothetical protein
MINLYTPEMVVHDYLGDMPLDILIARKWVGSANEPILSERLQSTCTGSGTPIPGDSYMSAEVRAILQPFDRRASVTFLKNQYPPARSL